MFFVFLNSALENNLAPIVIMASNRGLSKIRGTDDKSPHGIPLDMLDRLLIIPTSPYTEEEIKQILTIRCSEEDVEMESDAIALLTSIGLQTSLRYAIHLITASYMASKRRKAKRVSVDDVTKVYNLFVDVNRSSEYLNNYQEEYIQKEEGQKLIDMQDT